MLLGEKLKVVRNKIGMSQKYIINIEYLYMACFAQLTRCFVIHLGIFPKCITKCVSCQLYF